MGRRRRRCEIEGLNEEESKKTYFHLRTEFTSTGWVHIYAALVLMARYEELTIDKGSDVAFELHLNNDDGSIKDLSGYSGSAKMKKSFNSDSDNTYAFTAVVADPASQGILTLTMTNTLTDTIKAGRYVFDTEISFNDSDGNAIVERILEGRIHVTPSVT